MELELDLEFEPKLEVLTLFLVLDAGVGDVEGLGILDPFVDWDLTPAKGVGVGVGVCVGVRDSIAPATTDID